MELKIKGQQYLNANHYKRIRIRNINRDLERLQIDVINPKSDMENSLEMWSMKTNVEPFMKQIENLTEVEKIVAVVDYYLRIILFIIL